MITSAQRRKVWMIPSMLAMFTLAGLLSALLGERVAWKALAWTMLAVPLVVALWFACARTRA